MQRTTIPLAIAALAVIGGAGLLLLGRGPTDPPPVVESREREPPAPSAAPVALAVADAETSQTPATAKLRELEEMSETFRNTTFLIAIRDAGFVCNELLRVYGGLDESGKWTATCSEMLAYTVSVASTGTLRVEPMLQYFDGTGPAVLPSESGPGRQPRLLFPPQELPPLPDR